MAKTHLVIVESPAKAKTIGKYLGPSYQVKASMGHLRDLPKSKTGVDLTTFEPDYLPIVGKEDIIADLRKAAKGSDHVFLATDPDREGEAISWHLKELLKLPEEKTHRVTFNEITRKVVNDSIAAPRAIDQNLVDAQQARRVLDRIVGYQLSPLLWKKIRRGLSAGRVQSVAARMVTEREEDIRAFVPEEYWTLAVLLDRITPRHGSLTAQFHGREKKMELHSAAEVDAVQNAVRQAPFTVTKVKRQDKARQPAPPFITSTLQQDASRRLNMAPRRTMSIAQQLYEGVDLKSEGTVGLITYMRTDSLRISEEALAEAKTFIQGRYGKEYHPGEPRRFKTKSGAQDAHEAIRPSDVMLTPESIKGDLTSDQYRLYKLIWSRFLASQMSPAIYDSITVDVTSAGYVFRANHSSVKFSGFTAVYEEGRDEEDEPAQSPLPDLSEGEGLALKDLKPTQKFTQPPPRYTEATLIRALEERGVGRPSTYAPTISTILDREYAVKEGKHLRPTPLGEVVTGLMRDKFTDVVDPDFTARMEAELDKIEEGSMRWKEVLRQFYGRFSENLTKVEAEMDGTRIKVPDEVTEELCDLCGKNLVIKSGRFGRFLACPGYPDCSFTKPIIVEMPGKCPKCGGKILKKTSKKGYAYYGCEFGNGKNGPMCDFMTWDVPVKEECPVCGQTQFKKSGKGARKPFCINEACSAFLPEDKRGGYKKKTTTDDAASAANVEAPAKKKAAGKTPAKKTAGTAAKKAPAKKSAGTAVKKQTAKKAPAKKAGTPEAEQ